MGFGGFPILKGTNLGGPHDKDYTLPLSWGKRISEHFTGGL